MQRKQNEWHINWLSLSNKSGAEIRVRSGHEFWRTCLDRLPEVVDTCVLVLHYTGYGYSLDGLPTWLADALEQRPNELNKLFVVTFFHELFASGRFWQKSFWTSKRQKNLAIRIASASDRIMANRISSARWLEKVATPSKWSVACIPICSTIGEPKQLIPWRERATRAVTFGSSAYKQFALTSHAEDACRLMRSLGIRELVDIGEQTKYSEECYRKHEIVFKYIGKPPSHEISTVLERSQLAFLEYNPAYLEKSSVFASYMAHGVPCAMPYPIHQTLTHVPT